MKGRLYFHASSIATIAGVLAVAAWRVLVPEVVEVVDDEWTDGT